MGDELMVEGKSKLDILVIEDNGDYGANALVGLSEHNVTVAANLESALLLMSQEKFDYILSDVNFPSKEGEVPKENIEKVMREALESSVPVCFVTKADHHGLLELGDEGYITIKALTLGKLATSLGNMSDGYNFRKVGSEKSENIKAGEKTPEIWRKALSMLQTAVAVSKSSVDLAIRQVAAVTGLSFKVKPGGKLPLITVPKRKRRSG
jgi:DNA-binding response OmpR family regulator